MSAAFQKLTCLLFFSVSASCPIYAVSLLPEIQAYHSLGNRDSNYSTLAGGLAIQLSIRQLGPDRWLHLLGLFSPEQVGSARGKAGGWIFHSDGKGIEIGIYDQKRLIGAFKGAAVSIRHLEWDETHLGNKIGKISSDVIHLGWTAGSTLMFLMGVDLATLSTPEGTLTELQFALGGRIAF
ncbi:MAG: hypothetical protein HQM13_14780 [SAR324 cluster bacterium]|nr:hypothetical protein [SAR324 cluster bacterium]